MGTRSEHDVEESSEVEPVEKIAAPMQVSGPDIFVQARAARRDLMPASFRRGRHGAKDARRAQSRANHPCQGSTRMYLVDGDGAGEVEESRIALRRRFEDVTVTDATKTQESVAG
ncbi:MAG TPA: hypothetical protein VMU64_02050 [Acidimicrobiales bacterium]|nr:hypothetical protein [Acidimicrobiales bacterium]